MASVAEQLIGVVAQGNARSNDNLQTGAQLAQTVENIAAQRQKLEDAKREVVEKKWATVGQMYDRWMKLPDGAAKKTVGEKVIPAMLNNFGLDKDMNPAVAEMLAKDPTVGSFLYAKVLDGQAKLDDIISATKDPITFTQFVTENGLDKFASEQMLKSSIEESLPSLEEAAKFRVQQEIGLQKAETMGGPRQGQLDARRDDQAANAGLKVDNDATIKKLVDQGQRIDRDLLTLKSHPSVFTLNEIAQSIPPLLGAGAIASDFKVKEINPKTIEGELAKLKSYISSNPDQPAPDGSIKFFTGILDRLNGAVSRQAKARANVLGKDARLKYANNPRAAQVLENKVQSYAKDEWREGVNPSAGGFSPTSDQKAKFQSLTPQQRAKFVDAAAKKFGLSPNQIAEAMK